MALDEGQRDYLREHLPYMLKMMRYTYQQMLQRQHYLSFNAHMESFSTNARNMVNFLANKDTNNHKAGQFVAEYRARTGNLGQLMRKIDEQTMHLSKYRPKALVGKFNTDNAKEVLDWVEETFSGFLGQLPESERKFFDANKADPTYDQGFSIEVGPVEAGKPSACTASPLIATVTPAKPIEGSKFVYKIGGNDPVA